jgi:hypothetical protein
MREISTTAMVTMTIPSMGEIGPTGVFTDQGPIVSKKKL